MGSVLFQWQDPSSKLRLQQFKEGRVIKAATWWDEDDKTKDIFGARDERAGGTLLACSKRGRVACLVNTNDLSPPSFGNGEAEMLPVKFLKGEMSPEDFANDLKSNKDLSPDLTFYLLVADVPLNSMFYISKKSMSKEIDEIRVVTSGVHYLLDTGLDDKDPSFHTIKRMKEMLDVVSDYDDQVLSNKEIAVKLMKDDEAIVPKSEGECETSNKTGQEEDFGYTLVEVEPTGKVSFYEISMVNGEEKKNIKINFNLEVNG